MVELFWNLSTDFFRRWKSDLDQAMEPAMGGDPLLSGGASFFAANIW